MRLFQESVLLSFLLVAGVCIIGVLLREIFLMRNQLKIELGEKSRQKRHAGKSGNARSS
jgi:uncharacterized membrane protein YciS (DUF1049 family)